MNVSSSTVPESLSLAMRDGSRAEHDAAEQSPFISELLAGRVNTDGYVDYLMRLQMIYTAIEDAVRTHREDPLVAAVYDPVLERHHALAADLEHWAPGTRRQVNSAAAQAYQDRIAKADWTGALVAHHYVRYLAISRAVRLSGACSTAHSASAGPDSRSTTSPCARSRTKTRTARAWMS